MVIVNEAGRWVGHILGQLPGVGSASNGLSVATETAGAGEQSFSVYAGNDVTGPYSTDVSTISTNESTTVENNNNADITNNITASADTGNNQATYNTGAGVISTGDADTALNLVNLANTNVTAKKIVVLLVNVIGDFLGNVIPTGYGDSTEQTNNGYNQGGVPDALPTLSPLPTIQPLPDLDITVDQTTDFDYTPYVQNQGYYYEYPASSGGESYYPEEYVAAVNNVNYQRYRTYVLRNYVTATPSPTGTTADSEARVLRRGLFLSNNFAKATQATFPGILLGGVSLRVTSSWLAVLPLALFMLYWRRRKKVNIDLTVYLNNILEVIL